MPSAHAVLSPSAAARWIACPASVRASAHTVSTTSKYAEEGTCAHARAEIEARHVFGETTAEEYTRALARWRKAWSRKIGLTPEQDAEMATHAEAYVALIQARVDEVPNSSPRFEQRMPTGIPSCWGTADTVVVSPTHVEVVDFKYGMGVKVAAHENPQLMLYGVAALETFGDILGETEWVRCTVFQPRIDHVESYTLDASDLRLWRDGVIPIAELALNGEEAPFNPGTEQCRWCPIAGECRAQLEWATHLDFGTSPDLLSPHELGEALSMVQGIKDWLNALDALALDKLYTKGEQVPGWKVVRSGGRRSITNGDAAIADLVNAGLPLSDVSVRRIKGIGDLEKLLGQERFAKLMGPYVVKGEGSLSLAPESDGRPSATPNSEAANVFREEEL